MLAKDKMIIKATLVLYHNKQSDVDKVIDSVLRSSIKELYIVDHSANDEFKSLLSRSDRIHYMHTDNDGYGKGHNLGFSLLQDASMSDYHIVLNPDIVFEPEAIDNLLAFMNEHKDVGLVMPKVFYPNGDFQYLCKLLPTPFDIFFRQFAPKLISEINDNRYAMKTADFDMEMDVPSLSGCFMFFRSECFKRVGGFDERYFMHFEDIDITRRIGMIARTVYFPGASIIHAHEAAHKKSKRMLMIGFQSAVKYFNKWGWLFDSERRKKNKEALRYLN